ncbi:hypothetical protein [Methylobacterium planeticum]|uniref:hypothetical protein n=1 Tax=Methylobacterium planeticum TaxID=2615211 RepID=UPI00177AEC4F|nr:hypothetical protein [Methylobacterium planeticum]
MDEALSLAWTEAEARSREAAFRRLLLIALMTEGAWGSVAVTAPAWIASLLELGGAPVLGWVRACGGLVLLAVYLQIPGLLDPVNRRLGNILGIGGRFVLAAFCLCLGGRFLWLAPLEGGLGLLLSILYFGLFRAVLMSRP